MTYIIRCCMLALVVALTGCATQAKNPADPLEPFNRAMFSVNDKVDQVAIKPAAKLYKKVFPEFVQTGVGNFFGNIGDISTALNNFLQARGHDGMSDVGRVLMNSTFGVLGLFDFATPAGLPKHDQDFGQTLGRWGVKSGPYLVLPLIGPTTTRDAVALPVDLKTDLWSYKYPVRWRNTGTAIRLIDRRAYVLDSSTLIEDAALDKYEFVRDAYLQRRQSKIYTGDPIKPVADNVDNPDTDTAGAAPVVSSTATATTPVGPVVTTDATTAAPNETANNTATPN